MSQTSVRFTPRYHELMREFPLRRLRTKRDAQVATDILDRLMVRDNKDPGEAAYVFVLSLLMEEYENKYDPTADTAGGLDVLRHLIKENHIRQIEIADLLGISQSAVSMLLSGRRELTAAHARCLGKRFNVDPGIFIQRRRRSAAASSHAMARAS